MLTRQPSQFLALNSGLTAELVYCLNFAVGLEDLSGRQQGVSGVTGTRDVRGSPVGVAGYFNGSSCLAIDRDSGYVASSSSPHTMLGVFRSVASATNSIVGIGEVTDSNYSSGLVADTSTGNIIHRIDTSVAAAANFGISSGNVYCAAIAVRGAADRSFAVNGRVIDDTTSVTGGTTTGGLSIGQMFRNSSPTNDSGFFMQGFISLVVIWNRALDRSEIAKLTLNPWQLFVDPAQSRMNLVRAAYVPAAAGTFQNIVGRPFSLAGVHGLAGD